jgi:hypothetical protein
MSSGKLSDPDGAFHVSSDFLSLLPEVQNSADLMSSSDVSRPPTLGFLRADLEAELCAKRAKLAGIRERGRLSAPLAAAEDQWAKLREGRAWLESLMSDDPSSLFSVAMKLRREIEIVNKLRSADRDKGMNEPDFAVPNEDQIRQMITEPGHRTLRTVVGQLEDFEKSVVGT